MGSRAQQNRARLPAAEQAIEQPGFVVFPTKLRPSPPAAKLLTRDRLLSRLDGGAAKNLTLLCAPAGFGKTVLLSHWYGELRERAVRTAWVTLDSGDKEPARCLTCIETALTSPQPVDGADARRQTLRSTDLLLRNLYNWLSETGDRSVLILDAYEKAASAALDETIYRLLRLMPDNLHLALACRTAPADLTGKLQAEGRVNRIAASELCFTEQELAELVGESADPSMATCIAARTQGWPAVARLYADEWPAAEGALPIDDAPCARVPVSVQEYVSSRLLQTLPERTRETLARVSFLERITPELTDRICRHDESPAILSGLTALHPLFSRTDEHGAYGLNPVLRDCLRLSLEALATTERNAVHSTVIDWYIEESDVGAATRYAELIGDSALSCRIVEHFGPNAIVLNAGITGLRAIMENIHTSTINRSAPLKISEANLATKDGHFALAKRLLAQARKLLDSTLNRDDPHYGLVKVEYIATEYLLSLYSNENFNREYLDRCEIETYQNWAADGLLGFIHALKSLLCQRAASFSRADAEADRSLAYYRSANSDYGTASVHLVKGIGCFAKGQLDLAARSYENALAIIDEAFPQDPGLNAIADSLVAEVRYERNEIDNLQEPLDFAIDTLESNDGWLDTFIAAYRVATAIALTQNDFERANMILDRATLLAAERGLDEIGRLALLSRINVRLREGDIARADALHLQYVENNGLPDLVHDRQAIWREIDDCHFTLARLSIARGEGEAALDTLEPVVQDAHRTGRLLSMTRGHVLQSLAYQSLDRHNEAVSILRHAVTVGSSEKYVRVFLDEGDGIVPTLQSVIDSEKRDNAATRLSRYCSRLLSAYRRESEAGDTGGAFTPRERQILIGLSHGNPNKTIARGLGITESTVKFHLKKIYSKLGVSKRSTAVIEARRQRLL